MDLHHTPQLQFTPRGIAGTVLVLVMLATVMPFMEIPNMSAQAVIEPQRTSLIQEASPTQASEESSLAKQEPTTPASESESDKPQQQRTELISVSGKVYDPEGKLLAGAQVFAVTSPTRIRKLSNTVSDDNGRYELKDLELPTTKDEKSEGDYYGAFKVFAVSEQLGFTWREAKTFSRDMKPFRKLWASRGAISIKQNEKLPVPDSPLELIPGQKIELDLVFNEPKRMRLRAIDDEGVPLANARVRLWHAEPVPGAFREFVTSLPIDTGFTPLYVEGVMPEELVSRTTDSEGWFEFAAMPSDCEFRIKVKPQNFAERMIMATTGTNYESRHDVLYSDGQDLVFPRAQPITVVVTFADSKKPAPRVWVHGGKWNGTGSDDASTDETGKVTLNLPPGECNFIVLPEYLTPYTFIDDDSLKTVIRKGAENEFRIELQRAVEVEIHVVDAITGKPVKGADVWTTDYSFKGKSTYCWGSFQQPNIFRQGPVRSDNDGIIRTYFRPGKYSLGLCDDFTPTGYQPTEIEDAVECEFSVKEKSIVTLKLQPTQ